MSTEMCINDILYEVKCNKQWENWRHTSHGSVRAVATTNSMVLITFFCHWFILLFDINTFEKRIGLMPLEKQKFSFFSILFLQIKITELLVIWNNPDYNQLAFSCKPTQQGSSSPISPQIKIQESLRYDLDHKMSRSKFFNSQEERICHVRLLVEQHSICVSRVSVEWWHSL